MIKSIAVIPGDGIGSEITSAAVRVLEAVAARFGHQFRFSYAPAGGAAIDACGAPLPEETLALCRASDAVLLGALGGPKWDGCPAKIRPEAGLLSLRRELGLYANLRPAILYPALTHASPLKPSLIGNGLDLLIVRELTGGIYFGRHGSDEHSAYDTETYYDYEIRRIAETAFQTAQKRKKCLVSVDKANVLESSRLWRKIISETAENYPEVTLSHLYVDNAAMQLASNPAQFDVIVTSNLFGDILSDLAAMITGSIGLLPSASIGSSTPGVFEPIHGSAPDLAGKDTANPAATILSAAMMLKYAFSLTKEAEAVEAAVQEVIASGYRTVDIAEKNSVIVGTQKMAELIVQKIEAC